jgi:peptide/nickel transport system permease protein
MFGRRRKPLFAGTLLEIPYLKFKRGKLGVASLIILAVLYAGLLFEGFLAPYSPSRKFKTKSFQPPHRIHFFHEGEFIGPFVYEYVQTNPNFKEYRTDRSAVNRIGFFVKGAPYRLFFLIPTDIHLFGSDTGSPVFLFGADSLGRDIFSRIVYGAKISLTIGFVSIFLALAGGILIGGLAGYAGGVSDWIAMRAVEIVILLPTFYFFLFLRSVMPTDISPERKFFYITAILAVPSMVGSARSIRNWVLSLKNTDYVTSAVLSGVPRVVILLRHIIPQIRNILILSITLSVPGAILGEAGLSFLNLGITEPSVSWGMLMNSAMDINVLIGYPWMLLPAAVIIVTVFSFFAFGYALKDALDPKA